MAKTKTDSQLAKLREQIAAVSIDDPKAFHPAFWRSLDDSRYYLQCTLAFTKNASVRELCISTLATLNEIFDGLYGKFLESQKEAARPVHMEVKHESEN